MIISWYGQFCFQITTSPKKGELVSIIIDPFGENTGLKLPKMKADILSVTHSDDPKSMKQIIAKISNEPFLIDSPGEYEIKGIFIEGIPAAQDSADKKKKEIVIYTFVVEGIRICHLGDLALEELSSEQMDKIGDVDILMVSTGGDGGMDPKQAAKIVKQVEPRIVIPMHYQIPGLKKKLEKLQLFLDTMGIESAEPQNKLVIKKKDLPAEKTIIMTVKP